MSTIRITALLALLLCGSASADVWKWEDESGKTHFVDTNTAIFTWVEDGRVYYSDTPDHEDAIAVQLVWISKGTLENIDSAEESTDGSAFPGETPDQRLAREQEEARYCKTLNEIYDSYKNAPRLYKTNEAGEREYLSKDDAKSTTAETKAKIDEHCS